MQFHYVYKLVDDVAQMSYIGVRTSSVDPKEDAYMSSSKIVKHLISEGRIFKKIILSCWPTRIEAGIEESRLHRLYSVGTDPGFYNLTCAPFLASHGTALKGRTYEQIHGIEKAKTLRRVRSKHFKNRKFSHEQRRKMCDNHADVSGSNNPKAIGGNLFDVNHQLLFSFSCKKELTTWCKTHNIPHRRLSRKGCYRPKLTNRNRKFSHLFGIYIKWNSESG